MIESNLHVINGISNERFKVLEEHILDKDKWSSNKFIVFNYEAGTGKSIFTINTLGQMTKEYKYKVLFVQMFSKDDGLNKTAADINRSAGREVAYPYYSDNSKKSGSKAKACNAQILCITHKMYRQICLGLHKELISNRDILIIDEFIELMEPISITLDDIKNLWGDFQLQEAQKVAEFIKNCYYKYNTFHSKAGEMVLADFGDTEDYEMILQQLISRITDKDKKELLGRLKIILGGGGLFYEGGFHSFNNACNYVMLKNNIILDANGGLDYRYTLSDLFCVKEQQPIHNYSNTTFLHYGINTSKTALRRQPDFLTTALDKINFVPGNKVLFVTDKENEKNLNELLIKRYEHCGKTIPEIETKLGITMSIDHFGNLTGKNDYWDYDVAVILKTPNFSYRNYVLNYHYYSNKCTMTQKGMIKVFKDPDIEQVRTTMLASEIYQALKRINRDNSRSARYYVFCNNQEAMKHVIEQFPGVRPQYEELKVIVYPDEKLDKRKSKDKPKFNASINAVNSIIKQKIAMGATRIKKKELRVEAGVNTKHELSRILFHHKEYLQMMNISNKGQYLFLNR